MIVISKNGIKLDIQPKNWWNLAHWFWVLDQAEIIKNQDFYLKKDGWRFTYGTINQA